MALPEYISSHRRIQHPASHDGGGAPGFQPAAYAVRICGEQDRSVSPPLFPRLISDLGCTKFARREARQPPGGEPFGFCKPDSVRPLRGCAAIFLTAVRPCPAFIAGCN